MLKYRNALPQLSDRIFLTDGGIETTLIFREGLELPYFAAFHLLHDVRGKEALRNYFRTYAALARKYEVGIILESATWRANDDWGVKLGYSEAALAEVNREAIELLQTIRDEFESEKTKVVISGCVGPRSDGYIPGAFMDAEEAQEYHRKQIAIFGETDADMVSALTVNYVDEAIGIATAARSTGIPVVISFTVETDGRLSTGQTLRDAVEAVDRATDGEVAYYMINCAHPTHFVKELDSGEPWIRRIHGLRANASVKSHAELNESPDLDDGDPVELGHQYRELLGKLSNLNILGGCCGTDHRHVEEICKSCLGLGRLPLVNATDGHRSSE
jgi:S-methylmethionine-dependent homocysteine/selenocysteine methylase